MDEESRLSLVDVDGNDDQLSIASLNDNNESPTVPPVTAQSSKSKGTKAATKKTKTEKRTKAAKSGKNPKTTCAKPTPKRANAKESPQSEAASIGLEASVDQVKERFSQGCECCRNGDKESCFANINPEMVYRHRLNIAELTRSEHDMYLMGVTMASVSNPEETARHKERKRLRTQYVFQVHQSRLLPAHASRPLCRTDKDEKSITH